jgi:hypothetical protein
MPMSGVQYMQPVMGANTAMVPPGTWAMHGMPQQQHSAQQQQQQRQ